MHFISNLSRKEMPKNSVSICRLKIEKQQEIYYGEYYFNNAKD